MSQDKRSNDNRSFENLSNKGRGMQGVDKAPGEEAAQSTDNPVAETQKGKGKVDGDPWKESDQPVKPF